MGPVATTVMKGYSDEDVHIMDDIKVGISVDGSCDLWTIHEWNGFKSSVLEIGYLLLHYNGKSY